jgi:plastocyanin
VRRLVVAAVLALLNAPCALMAGGTGAVKGTVTTGPATPVANAVVLIEGPTTAAPSDAPHAVIDQRDDTFVPHVLAIPVGTTVDFLNSDPHIHNVVSNSRVKPFDLGMYLHGEKKSVTFDQPGVVPLRCNVHPKMEAYVVVHTNPYAAVTNEGGEYTITGIPAGSYTARVWHERLAEKTGPVIVREDGVARLDMHLDRRE